MKRGISDLAVGAETEILLDCKPTRPQKVIQKVGVWSLGMPRIGYKKDPGSMIDG